MKGFIKKLSLISFSILISTLLAGCTIGEYRVFDFYTDANGNLKFMLIGQIGPSGNVEETEETEETEQEMLEDETENEDLVEETNDLSDIVGTSLKKGWTSLDNSILKGKNVSVKKDSILFTINLKQEKEVTITYDILLDEGEYSLVYMSPDNEEEILLKDDKTIHMEEKIVFTKGQNQIIIRSDNAVFNNINISIAGLEVSDFE